MTAVPPVYGKYQLLELIARGGMAEVYKAKSHGVEGFEKLVVIKRILPEFSQDASFVDMFIKEAKIAVTLSHANIVQVFDLGRSDDSYFIAMEYVHGTDLSRILALLADRGERFPVELAAYVISEVAKGLDYAHRRKDQNLQPLGIVHRDVSPQNILISYEGEVKIADFGIARVRGALGMEDSAVKGKTIYMAPEQARADLVDRRADIYATGVVLHEILAGGNPFAGVREADVVERVQEGKFAPLLDVVPDIPAELVDIVDRAMAVDRDKRHTNAGLVYEDLIAFLYTTGRRVGVHDLAQFVERLRGEAEDEEPQATERSLRAAFDSEATTAEREAAGAVITRVELPSAGSFVGTGEEGTGARPLATERRDVTALAVEMLGVQPPEALIKELRAQIEARGAQIVEGREDFLVALFGLEHADGRDTETALECALEVKGVIDDVREQVDGLDYGLAVVPAKIVMVAPGGVALPREDDRYLDLVASVRALAGRSRLTIGASAEARGIGTNTFFFRQGEGEDFELVAKRPLGQVYGRFVGRKKELRQIGELLAKASRGAGGGLVLAGDAGTGKTRLFHETRTRLRAGGHEFNWYQVSCAHHLHGVAHAALAAMFRAVLGVTPTDKREKVRDQVERLRELGLGSPEVDAVAQLLGLPADRAVEGASELLRQVRVALVRVATKLSEDRLTVLAWDGAEQMDNESKAATLALVREARRARALVLISCRPPCDFEWDPDSKVAEVSLGALTEQEATKLALSRLRSADVPLALLNEIADKTGGNPLFVEEYVKALFASGSVQLQGSRVSYRPEVAEIEVPKSLRGLIGARIGRLDPDLRGYLQRTAILAPTFRVDLLASVSETTVAEAADAADALARERILERKPSGEFGFVSDMLRDVVYDGITFPDRREIHKLVAAEMERLHAGRLHEVSERLAIHYRESGQRDKAADFMTRAGDRRATEHAHGAALLHYLHAVDLLQNVPRLDLPRILDLYHRVGRMAMASGKVGLGLEKMRLAIELAEEVGDNRAAVGLLTLAGRLLAKGSRFGEAQQYFTQALDLSSGLTDEALRRDVLGAIGETLSRNGEYRQAIKYLEEALDLSRVAGDGRRAASLSRELSHCWAARGDRDKALGAMEEAAREAAATGDHLLECEVQKSRGLVSYMLRDDGEALEAFSRALEIAKEYGFPYEIAVNSHNLGDLQLRTGDYRGAFTQLRFSHEASRRHGLAKIESLNMTLLGFIDAVTFRSSEGLGRIENALEFAKAHGYTWDVIQAQYYLGRACLELGETERARQVLREAISLSRATDNLVYLKDCETLLEGLDVPR